jgi:hypothetical protein
MFSVSVYLPCPPSNSESSLFRGFNSLNVLVGPNLDPIHGLVAVWEILLQHSYLDRFCFSIREVKVSLLALFECLFKMAQSALLDIRHGPLTSYVHQQNRSGRPPARSIDSTRSLSALSACWSLTSLIVSSETSAIDPRIFTTGELYNTYHYHQCPGDESWANCPNWRFMNLFKSAVKKLPFLSIDAMRSLRNLVELSVPGEKWLTY